MTDYLMDPRADNHGSVAQIRRGLDSGLPLLFVEAGETGGGNERRARLVVEPAMARALVRALLPFCPEPGPPSAVATFADGNQTVLRKYALTERDDLLVEAALRVLGPVFAVDTVGDEITDDPF